MKSLFGYLLVAGFIGLSCSLPVAAETVSCEGIAPFQEKPKMTVVFKPFTHGKLTLYYPDGSPYLVFQIDELERVVRNGKLIYRDPQNRRGEFLVLDTPVVGGQNLSGKFTKGLNDYSKIPMMCSITGEPTPVVEKCPSGNPNSALIKAALRGSSNDAELALDCGANINFVDKRGCTALLYVLDGSCGGNLSDVDGPRSPDVVKDFMESILDAGANVEAQDPRTKETPIIKAARFGSGDGVQSLVELAVEINAQDRNGNTALMVAAASGDLITVEALIEGDPDLDLKNKKGKTAYQIAKDNSFEELYPLLATAKTKIVIIGNDDGTCTPSAIEITLGETAQIELRPKGSTMFSMTAPDLDLELMSMSGEPQKKIIVPQRAGTFPFSCGFHGGPGAQQTKGVITVK